MCLSQVDVVFGSECKNFKQKYALAVTAENSPDCCMFEVSWLPKVLPAKDMQFVVVIV